MKIKPNSIVTIVDNKSGEEVTGRIKAYLPDEIVLEVSFDARKVHFKNNEVKK